MKPAPDGDEVEFYVSHDSQPGTLTVVLRSGPAVSWWKGVKVFGNNSSFAIGLLETQDHAHGPSTVTLDLGDFVPGQARLEFWKAKAFGVHTDMAHYTFDPEPFAAQTLNFSWLSD
jgi:hypothetical protein